MRTCNTCFEEKPETEFRFNTKRKADGSKILALKCKKCNYLKAKERRIERGEEYKTQYKAYRQTPEAQRLIRRSRWKKQGIDPDLAEQYFNEHSGKCDLCGRPDNNGKAFSIDHCHETGDIRGMLCNNCNRGLGLLQDDYHLLVKAARYVKRLRDLEQGGTLADLAKHGGTLEDLVNRIE